MLLFLLKVPIMKRMNRRQLILHGRGPNQKQRISEWTPAAEA